MSPAVQSYLALVFVAIAAAGLVWHFAAKKKKPGCGGDCACPSSDLKAKIRR